ncbi:serine hydrolase-domain-containing protein [Aspergillus avenaceus]|uniref:Serine hydrolase-domain-containing protein n=1 Tax=Aspergillus avenaceus TaxID=36643 RepID=A0A5N6TY73_ASPAV|nr:serine hydrolase-domain-containing protein [Aspergillus avenaceus]
MHIRTAPKAPVSQNRRTFRILMLHGYAQCSERFQVKAQLVVKQITKDILPKIQYKFPDGLEFIFPDAPIQFGGDDTSALEHRAWWLNLDDVSRYIGIETAILSVPQLVDKRPIHAAIGFSQGGALAGMLASLWEAAYNPQRIQLLEAQGIPATQFLDCIPGQRPLHFIIAFAGYRGTMEYYSSFYTSSLFTPSLHVIGTLDTIVSEEQSHNLVHAFPNAEVLYYSGHHYIPRDPVLLKRVGYFVVNACSVLPQSEEETMYSRVTEGPISGGKTTTMSQIREAMQKQVFNTCLLGALVSCCL